MLKHCLDFRFNFYPISFLQYLMGQFYSDKVYREFVDWERKSKISGTGTEAAFFSVCDRRTKCLLIMKEVSEQY